MINYFDNGVNDIIDQDDLYDIDGTNETSETDEFKEYSRDNEYILKHYDVLKNDILKLNIIV
jgi:hypothetical protein